ncbi:2-oxoacid:ferredoxin oxidoreductase subunit beta [Litorilinea aerophila]|uniref:2-oxoacid:ferredoxin oxidoreductase subunit beta n=1 Tax=Litorilinea aerophila TaxID=1204385 RepID=A0A540VMQ3_9CHLR|nr:2-oxoacid:ferredoxin oxidoreductase subunit beta [Litorilinea aerophila]MCC9075087.1 2-oxoacid:ferredoxin oxidoreductase subunit beta [Litorilinea aerophila]GIV79876.1 MAG: 2-oxoglutarate ferredoxin oxidoreductase subunit beta [Litorilinea sp.]
MNTTKRPAPSARAPKTNILGLEKNEYRGRPSTLCKGCGHDSISARIINAAWELGLDQTQVIKLSGIGCSSKTPAYFLGHSHGFNAVHGRMPSVATGALVANRTLTAIGVSGDGDTASIGIGQFKHAMRRNLPLVYIVENNGVYGLTKGQFSATADLGQQLKYAGVNDLPPLDICIEALAANATFVARSFAGDAKQVETLLKAALSHRGIAVLDIISPCVTFNNHETSTKSYSWGKEHEIPLHDLDFIPSYEEIEIDDYDDEVEIQLHDGSWIVLKKLAEDHDPTDRLAAYRVLEEARREQKLLTGLFYVNEEQPDMLELLNLVDEPLVSLPTELLRPSRESLEEVMAAL